MERFGKEMLKDILSSSRVGMFVFEKDEGCPPRMFFDESMSMICGIEAGLSPEETYNFWYDRILPEYYPMIEDVLSKTAKGERVEIQYEWNHPEIGPIFVRSSGS
ncbi:MAG: hybrid sensor histidine kinase/response regulator, partial [Lachnospiraceae bacterium]|nr:hybrid sensor histidine kinase/response regulator [Lachnospiraceae bacterium]